MSKTSEAMPSGRVLRQRIDKGQVLLGVTIGLPAPEILELARDWDWFWIDGQHGQLSYDTILNCVRVADLVGVPSVVRTAGHDYSQIGPILDTGAAGVIIPMVHNAEQGRAVVRAAKFPPLGQRSLGGRRVIDQFGSKYASIANQNVLVLAQIESVEGLANAEQIAAVPGIDGLLFGPADYALDCGLSIESASDISEPRSQEAARKIAQSCKKHGKVACSFVGSCETAARLAKLGYQMLSVSIDAALLAGALNEALAEHRRALKNG
ncbi:MAG: hypothetical protein KAT11_02540 [Phycisphaerae bacterium]|nr:hypothetical protein [Phycisphaerae bacterium]